MNNLRKRVDKLIGSVKSTDAEIRPEQHLIRDLGLDSLEVIELVTALEEEFDIMLQAEVMERVETVQDIYVALGQALGVDAAVEVSS